MFEFLKKKISDFTEKLKGKAEDKKPEVLAEGKNIEEAPAEEQKIEEKQAEEKEDDEESFGDEAEDSQEESEDEPEEIKKIEEEPEEIQETIEEPEKYIDAEKTETDFKQEKSSKNIPELKEQGKRELKAKTGIAEKLKGLVLGKVKIREEDTEEFFEELELSLLEADVEQEAAAEIVSELRKNIIGKEIPTGRNVSAFLNEEIKAALRKIMQTRKIDFWKMVEEKKPFVVLFLGPNGAGKTTTISKIAFALKQRGKSVVIAAADTFRAASIEQLEAHAERIGVKVVKQGYGADPAAVAFDAIAAAKARGIDVVLIDSAGRQETNKNLMQELKKIERVAKPDLKIYVGESFTGQALLGMAEEFDREIGLDGFCLTKIDADAKGGTAISLLYRLKKPILFVGIGQNYADLAEFSPEFIIDRIL
jgi:fused signal recognition particle receptor